MILPSFVSRGSQIALDGSLGLEPEPSYVGEPERINFGLEMRKFIHDSKVDSKARLLSYLTPRLDENCGRFR